MNKIVIFGPDGGGKSTLAKALQYDSVRSFSTPIKEGVHAMVGSEPSNRVEKESTYRPLYIQFGERAKELYGEDVWVKTMDYEGDNWIIDDGRFNVEYDYIVENIPDVITVYVNMSGVPDKGCEVDYNECEYVFIEGYTSPKDYDAFIEAFKYTSDCDQAETKDYQRLLSVVMLALMFIGTYAVVSVIVDLFHLII